MKKLLLLPLVIFAFTADAYIIDYNAINDDDKSINYGTNSVNYSIDGYKKNDQNVTSVKHDLVEEFMTTVKMILDLSSKV